MVYILISYPCYLPLSRTRAIEEKRRNSSESGHMSTGGPPRPPPSLIQLATVTAIANIQRLSNITSIPDNIVEELFEVRRTPLILSHVTNFVSVFQLLPISARLLNDCTIIYSLSWQ